MFPERRTRSQITLSDDVLRVPEGSPMKYARELSRRQHETIDDSEDELLLSPQRPKRSVSPPPKDEYSAGEPDGRELKRMKWDLGRGGLKDPAKAHLTKAGHSRTNSEPNVVPSKKPSRTRAASSSKPNSMSNASPTCSPTAVLAKSRAQSVPLFPSSSSLPQLDLRNPPLSPIRARSPSRSPKKHHGLKVHLDPPKELLTSERNTHEIKSSVDIEQGLPLPPISSADATMCLAEDSETPPVTIPEVLLGPPERLELPAPAGDLARPPATPASDHGLPFISLSPLTPLPDTPPTAKTSGPSEEDRYNAKGGWSLSSEKDSESIVQPIAPPHFGKPKNAINGASQSQIPRPSVGPPSQPAIKPTAGPVVKKSTSSSLKITTPKGSTSGADAFQLMMNAAKQDGGKVQNKGKGKTGSFGSSATTTAASKAEPESKKASVKDRMRHREKPKPAPPSRFVPLIFDEDEEQEQEDWKSEEKHRDTLGENIGLRDKLEESIAPVQGNAPSIEPSLVDQDRLPQEDERTAEDTTRHISPAPLAEPPLETEQESAGGVVPNQGPNPSTADTLEEHVEQEERTREDPVVVGCPVANNVRDLEVETLTAAEPQAAGDPHPVMQPESKVVDQPMPPVKEKSTSKKWNQSNIPTSTRITRSAFKTPAPPVVKPPATRRAARNVAPRKSLPDPASNRKATATSSTAAADVLGTDRPLAEPGESVLPPGSPMQTSPPHRTPSRKLRTPGSSPAKISLAKTPSKPDLSAASPSPTKIARAVSMFSRVSDTFAVDDIGIKSAGSSLSTLSNALEKLKMPAPLRPNTSLGFNLLSEEADAGAMLLDLQPQSPSGATDGQEKPGLDGRGYSLKRSFTVAHGAPSKSSAPASSSSQAGPSTNKMPLIQKPMTLFLSRPGSTSSSNLRLGKGSDRGKPSLNIVGAKGKGVAGVTMGTGGMRFPMPNRRLVQKVSKKSSLPVVEASPVKGGGGGGLAGVEDDSIIVDDVIKSGEDDHGRSDDMGDTFMVPIAKESDTVQTGAGVEKDKEEKEKKFKKDSSRRASLALSQLSQSLSAAPTYSSDQKGTMGPPATPRKIVRSASSSYPAPSNTDIADPSRSSKSPDKVGTSLGTRFSARQAAKTAFNADAKSPSTSSGPTSGKKDSEKVRDGAAKKAQESLGILKDCVLFVDVRTDDGEEAGSLFVEMLEGLGAKIQARVGQTCTHIIFKNGLMSTISRYRLLRDPKPTVVGIAWVVDCVEQRRHVEESQYLIDLNEVNIAGTNKRRRSMLPKLISRDLLESNANDTEGDEGGDADVSMDGSASSITLDDDLTPLERARRRRSMIFGPTT